ncbi:MAG: hypothetical protein Q4B22_02530 [Eubacteriales bacterium]|nr:hypothetical protein [Eubacteriales bacterium]
MAQRRRAASAGRRTAGYAGRSNRRVNSTRSASVRRNPYNLQESYEDGNAVRVLDDDYYFEEEKSREARPKVSERTKKNRARAKNIGSGYVAFLAAVCMLTVLVCIAYLQLRSELTNQMETIAAMESSLSKLQADNDAYYKQAQTSVSMDDVRSTALDKLGMHYANESQIYYYNINDESYVRQYERIRN